MTARKQAAVLLASLLVALAACGGGAAGGASPLAAEASGQQLFASYCGLCHGANGEGRVNALDAPALDASGDTYLLRDDEIRDIILRGTLEAGGQMQPLAGKLTDAQVTAVIEYLPSLWTADQRATHDTLQP